MWGQRRTRKRRARSGVETVSRRLARKETLAACCVVSRTDSRRPSPFAPFSASRGARRRFAHTCRECARPESRAYLRVHQQRATAFARASGAYDAAGEAALACARKGRGSASGQGSTTREARRRDGELSGRRGVDAYGVARDGVRANTRTRVRRAHADGRALGQCVDMAAVHRATLHGAGSDEVADTGRSLHEGENSRWKGFCSTALARIEKIFAHPARSGVHSSSLFFSLADVVAGKQATFSLSVFAPKSPHTVGA